MARMSNRDRIQRMAEEAAAGREEKAAKAGSKKAKAPAAPPGVVKRKAPAARGRMKIMWAVGVPGGKTLQTFPYPRRAEADAEAARLTSVKGTLHVVRDERHPMEDGE